MLVPDRERKHAAKISYALGAILLERVKDRFGIALGSVEVAGLLESRTKLSMVEDLAVVRDPQAVVLVRHWLPSAGKINNAQAAMAQKCVIVVKRTGTVRTTMANLNTHGFQHALGATAGGRCDEPGYSAHTIIPRAIA